MTFGAGEQPLRRFEPTIGEMPRLSCFRTSRTGDVGDLRAGARLGEVARKGEIEFTLASHRSTAAR